ncbi:hypothetical protein CVT25_012805 [Psilocybe cyanescens]|uniref:MYND-type domain-containing protein n=1 Tax=Psilocybe cyanescens TaxID=93625 RepID=A0A409XLK1_PSICY|nr:hypothetical protein CVT25_012805 [Psilocybe cyanescens]
MVKPTIASVKEPLRKELTTCQNCGKSRLEEGVTLSKCSGCKIALYCSKDCQRAGWPVHKTTCKLNQRSQTMAAALAAQSPAAAAQGDVFKALRAFCSKHRPSIAEYGIRALDLPLDPTRSLREVVLIKVKSVPNAKRAEMSFMALSAELVPAEALGRAQGEELRSQLKNFEQQQKRMGQLGGIMVLVFDIDTNMSNACPVGFGKDVLTLKPGQPWKEPLLRTLNSGTVY